MFTILMFVVLLSVVVLFHEFGHFIVGRFFKFGIDAFAVGFGRALLKYKKGEVEYRLNWIPFGGYVKFVGEVSDEEVPEDQKHRAFSLRPAYQKAAVVFAGPFMNLVLAFLIFSIMFLVGFPTTTTLIGYVQPDSPAAQAGIVPGDRIVEIEGQSIWRWEDMSRMIEERPEQLTRIAVERDGQRLDLSVTPKLGDKLNVFRLPEQKGLIGVDETGYKPIIGVPDPQSPAASAGLSTGMLITKVDGRPIFYRETLERLLADGKGHSLSAVKNFTEPEDQWKTEAITLPALEGQGMAAYGVEFTDLYIYEVTEESPAQKAGLLSNDKILSVEGAKVDDWNGFTQVVQENPEKTLALTVLRAGQPLELSVIPELVEEKDMMGEKLSYGRIGILRMVSFQAPEMKPEKYLNPIMIFKRGVELSYYWTAVTLKAFGLIFTGDVSPKSMGGPITIAVMAGESARMGAFPFFLLMAIISLNLAVVNLIPVPIFDGGHLMFYTIEMIIRRPVSDRIREAALRVGVAMTGLLILMVLYFDLNRYSGNIKELFLKMVNF